MPFSEENKEKAKLLISLYPQKRSALIPLCHLAQGQAGYLARDLIEEIAQMLDLTPMEVIGTASFYDMFHLEPVGKYLINICTNVACMLNGAYELLEYATKKLGIEVSQTTDDNLFTLEETECLAACDNAPCVQVNHRFFFKITPKDFDELISQLRQDKLDIPPHGVLIRNLRTLPKATSETEVLQERIAMDEARARRENK
jgi:NADH-quinone oxidoreductase subunit E